MKALPGGTPTIYVSAPSLNETTTILSQAASSGDPLMFFLAEDMMLRFYRQRIPQWRPTRPQDWMDIIQRRKTYNQVKQMIEDHHLRLMQAVFVAQTRRVDFDADLARRELEWTEQLRHQEQQQDLSLTFQAKVMVMQAEAQRVRDERGHRYAKELLDIQHQHEERMRRLGIPTATQRMADVEAVNERIRQILKDIEQSGESQRVKNQRATMIIDISRKIFD